MTAYPIEAAQSAALIDRLALLTALALAELPKPQRESLTTAMNAGRTIRVQRVEESLDVSIDGRLLLTVSIPALLAAVTEATDV